MVRVGQTHVTAHILGHLTTFEFHPFLSQPLLFRKRLRRRVPQTAQPTEEKKDEALLAHYAIRVCTRLGPTDTMLIGVWVCSVIKAR